MQIRSAAAEMKQDVFFDIILIQISSPTCRSRPFGSYHDHKNHVEQLLPMQLTALRAAVRQNVPTAAKSSVSLGQQLLRVVLVNLF